jgi:hypothetical protein
MESGKIVSFLPVEKPSLEEVDITKPEEWPHRKPAGRQLQPTMKTHLLILQWRIPLFFIQLHLQLCFPIRIPVMFLDEDSTDGKA